MKKKSKFYNTEAMLDPNMLVQFIPMEVFK